MILRKRREDNILGLHLDQKGLHDDLSPIHMNSLIYDLVESNCWAKTFNLGPAPPRVNRPLNSCTMLQKAK
jgi:hypothetical protein